MSLKFINNEKFTGKMPVKGLGLKVYNKVDVNTFSPTDFNVSRALLLNKWYNYIVVNGGTEPIDYIGGTSIKYVAGFHIIIKPSRTNTIQGKSLCLVEYEGILHSGFDYEDNLILVVEKIKIKREIYPPTAHSKLILDCIRLSKNVNRQEITTLNRQLEVSNIYKTKDNIFE